MGEKKFRIIPFSVILIIATYGCITPIILPGDISGSVTDEATDETIPEVSVTLQAKTFIKFDTTETDVNGNYLFKNLEPDEEYVLKASKFGYEASTQPVYVESAQTQKADFDMKGIPIPSITPLNLDFGLDLTSLSFAFSNIGHGGILNYNIKVNKEEWITVFPMAGIVDEAETDSITVTINRTLLSDSLYKAEIVIISTPEDQEPEQLSVGIYINGLIDNDVNFYRVVRIGTQTWMAENLNVGTMINLPEWSADNDKIEKYCYFNNPNNCIEYGGLYLWDEMMQYNPSDNGTKGTTQGICPSDWHIPTQKEWDVLIQFIGGYQGTAHKLKEKLFEHWPASIPYATDEFGFTALPAGFSNNVKEVPGMYYFNELHMGSFWWGSNLIPNLDNPFEIYLRWNNNDVFISDAINTNTHSVRCLKN
jgi:uncharacterized protein (TIGR02145 family)